VVGYDLTCPEKDLRARLVVRIVSLSE